VNLLRTNLSLWLSGLFGLAVFAWPLLVPGLIASSELGSLAVLALAPIVVALVLLALGRGLITAKELALLGVLAALGSALRIATSGVGGFEAVFILIILAGRAFGARFGFLLGVLTIAVSSVFWGGFGPWTAFQMLAVGWVGLGAGVLPKASKHEIKWLVGYTVLASYAFGLIMNLWFWPFAVGPETSISYSVQASVFENLASFFVYSLTTSTLTWDTVRAVTVSLAIAFFGKPVLNTLRRAKLTTQRSI
jgi:hypothetical protein